MNHEHNPRTATLRLEVPDRILAWTLIEDWAGRPGASVNLIRARVTPDASWVELEVRGTASDVAEILREGARWGLPRRAIRSTPVPAFA